LSARFLASWNLGIFQELDAGLSTVTSWRFKTGVQFIRIAGLVAVLRLRPHRVRTQLTTFSVQTPPPLRLPWGHSWIALSHTATTEPREICRFSLLRSGVAGSRGESRLFFNVRTQSQSGAGKPESAVEGTGPQVAGREPRRPEDPLFPLDDERRWTSANHEPIRQVIAGKAPSVRASDGHGSPCELATWSPDTCAFRTLPKHLCGPACSDSGRRASSHCRIRQGMGTVFRTGPNPDRDSRGRPLQGGSSLDPCPGSGGPVRRRGRDVSRTGSGRRVHGFAPRRLSFLCPESHNGIVFRERPSR